VKPNGFVTLVLEHSPSQQSRTKFLWGVRCLSARHENFAALPWVQDRRPCPVALLATKLQGLPVPLEECRRRHTILKNQID
jgi:hypothetical protein